MTLKLKKDLYEKLKKEIELVLFNEEFFQNLNDEKFFNSFSNLLENFFLIEKDIHPNEILFNNFNNKLSKINKKIKISKKEIDSQNDIVDNINFINIFIKNLNNKDIHNSNLKSLDLEKKTMNKNIEENSLNENNDKYNYGDYDEYKKVILNQMIQKRLSEDLIKGNYYFYDSKPKFIPILRYFIGGMIIFAGLLFLAQFIIALLTNYKITIEPSGKPPEIINASLMSTNPFNIMLIFLIVSMLFYFGYKYLVPIKNDNLKYNISNFPLGMTIFMGFMFLSTNIQNIIDMDAILKNIIQSGSSSNDVLMFKIYTWLSLGLSIFLILFFIPLIINFILKPKKDIKLTKELTEKYRKEIYEQGIFEK